MHDSAFEHEKMLKPYFYVQQLRTQMICKMNIHAFAGVLIIVNAQIDMIMIYYL